MLEIFREAGWVAYPLGICSIIALGVTLERLYSLAQFKSLETKAFRALRANMTGGNVFPNADGIEGAPVSQVLETIRELRGHDDETLRYAAEISLAEQRQRLRRYLNLLATIGSTAPFIGLFGTVLGVMGAFKGMALSNAGGEAMAQGISEALSATALGLAVAVPSVIAYNLFLIRVQNMMLEIQGHVAFLIPTLNRSTANATAVREDVTMRLPAQSPRN